MSDEDRRPRPIEPEPLADLFWSRRSADGTLALVLDFGGTLTPDRDDPDEADLNPVVATLLKTLGEDKRFEVAVVSGRDLDDLDRHLGSTGPIFRFGDHGAEGTGPGMRLINTLDGREELARLRSLVVTLEGKDWPKGAWIERKGLCLTLHYEQASPRDAKRVQAELARKVGEIDPDKRLTRVPGKKIVEVRPAGLHKGLAVQFLRHRDPAPDCVLYAGDDSSDEEAFRVLEEGDLGVLVAYTWRESEAEYRLLDPGELAVFLASLARLAGLEPGI